MKCKRMNAALRSVLVIALACAGAGTAAAQDDVAAAMERYSEAAPQNVAAEAMAGRLKAANQKLETLVADARKTPLDHFIIGNMLYELDRESSLAHHRKAYEADPRRIDFAFEMAMQLQRRRDCAKALPLYRQVIEAGKLPPAYFALVAQCEVAQGDYAAAVRSWQRSNFRSAHTAVDFAIAAVYGDEHVLVQQDRLVNRVRAGDGAAVAELVQLPLQWRLSWWQVERSPEALVAAVDAITQRFGADSVQAQEAALLLQALKTEDAQALRGVVAQAGLTDADKPLPQNNAVLRWLVALALEREALEFAALDQRLHTEMLKRAQKSDDVDALRLAAGLAARAGRRDELRELDKRGWRQGRDVIFAVSYMIGLAAQADAKATLASELPAALRDFPEEPRLRRLAYELAPEDEKQKRLAEWIQAEYFGLYSDPERYARTLNGLYANLAKTLPAAP